ncbi:MAG: hypothetical protein AAF556_08710 [Pseudomonadota bacterium]
MDASKNQPPQRNAITLMPDQQPGWYRAMIDDGLVNTGPRRLASGPQAEKPVEISDPSALGDTVHALDSYNLLYRIAENSRAVRAELAGQIAEHLLAIGPNARGRYAKLTQARLDAWTKELTGDDGPKVLDAHLDEHQAVLRSWRHPDFPTAKAEDLQQTAWAARRARRDYGKGKHADVDPDGWGATVMRSAADRLVTDLAMAEMLVGIEHDLPELGPKPTKTRAAAMLTERLTSDNLIRTFDDLEPYYSDYSDQFGADERADRPSLDVISLAQRHWGEIDPAGSYPGGISIGNNAKRAVPAAAVATYRKQQNDVPEPRWTAEIISLDAQRKLRR